MTTPSFLSAPSANALISELRPTTVSPAALFHINALVDEILSLLVSNSESINPSHIRTQGIPAVFTGDKTAGETTGPKALGRSAVAEAELELRSWWETNPGAKRSAFGPDGQGTGVKGGNAFPIKEATELLKLKCVQFSTLAPSAPPSEAYEIQVTTAWKAAGGDTTDNTLSPAGLWTTAILEHICEHVLAQLSRVVARDSSIATAGVQDLYVALCEDESIWGLFKRLQVKESLENAIKTSTRQRKTTPTKTSQSQLLSGTSVHSGNHSKTSLSNSASARDFSIDQSRNSSSTPVEHVAESPSRKGPVSSVARAASSASKNGSGHQRSSSLLSANTKSIVSAFNDQYETDPAGRSSQDEDEFDALVRSGETMKVSLTPSRLKNFDVSPNRRAPPSPTANKYVRPTRPTQSPDPELSPLTPGNAQMDLSPAKRGPKVHSRSSSGQRLIARNAATIKEQENEDEEAEEFLDGPQSKKESLADMFAEPKAKDKRVSSSRSSGSSKRTVPAVVLGSPPPREQENEDRGLARPIERDVSVSSEVTGGRKTKRDDLTVETPLAPRPSGNNASAPASVSGGQRRGRTEAQELADFFNSTTPPDDFARPPSSPTLGQNGSEPPKSATAKHFKSFMSRMTGKKEKGTGGGGKEDRPPMPSAFPGTNPSVKRQKSFGSFVSGSTAAPAPPVTTFKPSPAPEQTSDFTSPRVPAPSPPVQSIKSTPTPASTASGPAPPRSLSNAANDARSNAPMGSDKVLAAGVAALTMGAGDGTEAVSPDRNPKNLRFDSTVTRAPRTGSDIETASQPPKPVKSQRIVQDISSSGSQRELVNANRAQPMLAPPIATRADDYVVVNKADAFPTPAGNDSLSPSARSTEPSSPSGPTPLTSGQHSQFPSEGASFTTASEGDRDIPPAEQAQVEEKPIVDTDTQPGPTLVPAPAAASQAQEHSIPISDLVALRGLLAHATTAKECQLLLNAILSQLGVPCSSENGETIDPEARVTAWLLAGREGPGEYTPIHMHRALTATTTTAGKEVSTPTLGDADLEVGVVGSARDTAKEGENGTFTEPEGSNVENVRDGEEEQRVREEVMGL